MANKNESDGDASSTAEVAQLRGSVTFSSAPLILLAVFGAIFFLNWAEPVLIPLVLGLIVSYALAPLVDRLERFSIPRGISAAVLLVAIVGGVGASAVALQDEAVRLIDTLPEAVQKFQESIRKEMRDSGRTIEKMQEAADELARTAGGVAADSAPPGVTRVQIEKPRLNIRDYLITNATAAATAIGVGLIVLFLAYFLLASGDAFRRKWVALSGPQLSRRRITVQVMDEIRYQILRYLAVQALTSVLVGVTSGLAFWAIGLENAAIWGVVAGVLNLVPYLGAVLTTAGTALVAFLQFGTPGMALAVASISLVINTLEGYLLMPWLAGRASRMNNVVVFSSLLFWGWLWGGWGLLLGAPLAAIAKTIADRIDYLKPVGEFMGE
jgi:predicted PurR-regulated permease PerM